MAPTEGPLKRAVSTVALPILEKMLVLESAALASSARLKTLMKKGSMVTLVPYYHSGCEITLVKDGDQFEYLGSFGGSLNTFVNIDFTKFTFNSNPVAFDNFTKKKIKKYKRLQIQIENNNAEPFGLTQITKTYTFGNYAKR